MKDHSGDKKGFFQLSKAWYGPVNLRNTKKTDEVTIGFYHPDGGTSGEFSIEWEPLAGKITPSLVAFNDSWHVLHCLPDLIEKMASLDEENISPDDFCKMLLSLGFKDLTPYENDL